MNTRRHGVLIGKLVNTCANDEAKDEDKEDNPEGEWGRAHELINKTSIRLLLLDFTLGLTLLLLLRDHILQLLLKCLRTRTSLREIHSIILGLFLSLLVGGLQLLNLLRLLDREIHETVILIRLQLQLISKILDLTIVTTLRSSRTLEDAGDTEVVVDGLVCALVVSLEGLPHSGLKTMSTEKNLGLNTTCTQ